MRDRQVVDEAFDSAGEGIELALPGDTIRRRHIATRASLKRRIIVLMVGDAEFEGYSIGLDEHSLQILELPSGEVSSVALEYIVAISDGKPFNELSPAEKNTVDKRTASFRRTSHNWLVVNWPNVYDRRDGGENHQNHPRADARPGRPSLRNTITDHQARQEFIEREGVSDTHADSEVRD